MPRAPRPEVLLFFAALIFLGGAVTHFQRVGSPPPPVVAGSAGVDDPDHAPGDLVVGPSPDDDLEHYVAQARARLETLAAADPDERRLAVASLTGYLTPDEAVALLAERAAGTVAPVAARYRLREPGEDPDDPEALPGERVSAGGDLRAALRSALEEHSVRALRRADEFEALAQSTDLEDFAAQFRADRDRLLRLSGRAESGDCPCVYALEVSGTLAALARLQALPEVRLVDVAPAGARRAELWFRALLPHG